MKGLWEQVPGETHCLPGALCYCYAASTIEQNQDAARIQPTPIYKAYLKRRTRAPKGTIELPELTANIDQSERIIPPFPH